ncbi:MAG TPA: hypothetical protein VM597_36850, partial [Gemmataceae bacterium]|nr:hypothetical protein [Gemmataceae bacterium]
MRRFRWAVGVGAVVAGSAAAGDPVPEVIIKGDPPPTVTVMPDPVPGVVPAAGNGPHHHHQPKALILPPNNCPPASGARAAGTLNPNMFGDFFGGAGSTRLLFAPTAKFTGSGDLV